jgi:hypothetical protein
MADLIPPMLIQLQADVSQLKAGLAQAESALKGVDDSVKTASAGMTSFVSKMKQVGATMGVAFAGQQVVQFGKDVIMAASSTRSRSATATRCTYWMKVGTWRKLMNRSWHALNAQAAGVWKQVRRCYRRKHYANAISTCNI